MVFFVLVDRGHRDVGAVGDGLVDADDLLGRRQRRADVGVGPNGVDEVLDHRVHEALAGVDWVVPPMIKASVSRCSGADTEPGTHDAGRHAGLRQDTGQPAS